MRNRRPTRSVLRRRHSPRQDISVGGLSVHLPPSDVVLMPKLHLSQIASGIMYNSWEAHYRQVTVLRFTPDGEALVSGSEDSGVSVWSVFRFVATHITSQLSTRLILVSDRLLDDGVQNENPEAYANLSDHTLPITDLACGFGPFPSCRVLSASTDHSVKVRLTPSIRHPYGSLYPQQIWDLSSKTLLTTFQFPHAVACIAWDLTERLFFAASTDGSIHQVNLFRTKANKTGGYVAETVGGGGVNDILSIADDDPSANKRRLISVGCVTPSLR
jgi:pre-rRNA-processing protein IPI3